jgi:hypothetical protein
MSLLCGAPELSCAIYDRPLKFRVMSKDLSNDLSDDTFFARCGELVGRWTAAFADGLRRGREYPKSTPAPVERTTRPAHATSDPEMHPFS